MRPGDAVQTLRGLHTANEPTRVQFVFELCQFLNAGPTEAQMQAFLSSGLLALLADIVSEPQSFVLDRALHVSTQLCISGTLLLTNELHVGSGSKGGLCSVNPWFHLHSRQSCICQFSWLSKKAWWCHKRLFANATPSMGRDTRDCHPVGSTWRLLSERGQARWHRHFSAICGLGFVYSQHINLWGVLVSIMLCLPHSNHPFFTLLVFKKS